MVSTLEMNSFGVRVRMYKLMATFTLGRLRRCLPHRLSLSISAELRRHSFRPASFAESTTLSSKARHNPSPMPRIMHSNAKISLDFDASWH